MITRWIALALLLTACDGGEPPDTDAGPARRDAGPCDPSFDGAPTEGDLEVGEQIGDAFEDLAGDPEIAFRYGPQGGTMITPVIRIPAAIAGDERCVEVTLAHRPDPDAPDAYDVPDEFQTTVFFQVRLDEEGGMLVTDPLFDQLGVGSLEGLRLMLDVTVRGAAFARTVTVPVSVIDDVPPACAGLSTSGSVCVYRVVPGEGEILAFDDGVGRCPDPRAVEVRFEPTDPTTRECFEAFVPDGASGPVQLQGSDPPSACLADLEVGDRVPMSLYVIEGGACTPVFWELALDACTDACP